MAYDLYIRGALELTWPDAGSSKDDIHARFDSGWYSIQVKTGYVNDRGQIVCNRGYRGVSSHVLALADLQGKKVRYISKLRVLPKELLDASL